MFEKSRGLSLLGNEHFWPRFIDPFRELGSAISNFFSPSADALDKEDSYEIRLELPGVNEKDVEICIENNSLIIRGEKRTEREEKEKNYYFSERRFGAFERAFRLPEDVHEAEIKATFKDGVLTIRIPKTEQKKPVSRKIEIRPN